MSITMGSVLHQNHNFPLPRDFRPPLHQNHYLPLPPDFMTIDEIERERVHLVESLDSVVTFLNNCHLEYPSSNSLLDRAVEDRFFQAGVAGPIVMMKDQLKGLMRQARNNITDGQIVNLVKNIHMSALLSLTKMTDRTGFSGKQLVQIANLSDRLLTLEERRNEEDLINLGTVLRNSLSGSDHVISYLRDSLKSQGIEGLNCISSPSETSSSSSIAANNSTVNQPTTSTTNNFNSNSLNAGARRMAGEESKRKSITNSGKGEVCSVCMEEIKGRDEDGKATIGCSHTFHFNCIFEWMKQQKTCPLCRYDINPDKRRRR